MLYTVHEEKNLDKCIGEHTKTVSSHIWYMQSMLTLPLSCDNVRGGGAWTSIWTHTYHMQWAVMRCTNEEGFRSLSR